MTFVQEIINHSDNQHLDDKISNWKEHILTATFYSAELTGNEELKNWCVEQLEDEAPPSCLVTTEAEIDTFMQQIDDHTIIYPVTIEAAQAFNKRFGKEVETARTNLYLAFLIHSGRTELFKEVYKLLEVSEKYAFYEACIYRRWLPGLEILHQVGVPTTDVHPLAMHLTEILTRKST